MSESKHDDIHIKLLQDSLDDMRGQVRFIKSMSIFLGGIVVACILAIVGLSVYHGERFARFLTEYDVSIESQITTDNSSQNDGNISVSRK